MTSDLQVLDVLLAGPATRPEIAAATGLSKPTVSDAIRRLQQAHLVRAAGQRHGTRGRSPTAYDLATDAGYVVGLDIGGANLRVLAADLRGGAIATGARPTQPRGGAAVAAQAIALLGEVLDAHGLDRDRLLGLGVSAPGVIDPETSRMSQCYNIGQASEFDLLSLIVPHFAARVRLDNNVNCAAHGERRRGHAAGVPTFAFVSVGAGIGMGAIYEGRVLRGRRGAAGEIGYLPLGPDPFAPGHRRRGGLEDEASASGMLDAAARQPGWPDGPPGSVQALFALAEAGVPAAQAIVDREARLLAMAVASVCTVIDPHLVVLGGGIGSNRLLLSSTREAVALLCGDPPPLRTSALGAEASVYGAMEMALDLAHDELRRRASANGGIAIR